MGKNITDIIQMKLIEKSKAIKLNSGFVKSVQAIAWFILSILLISFLSACSKKTGLPPQPSVSVTAGTVIQKTVPVQIRVIGNVEAYSTVSVKSQIGGELIHVHFKEGQDVQKGDILFTIDPRPYESALKQAEANLAKDTAQLENALEEVRRYAELVKKGYVAQEQYDQIRTNAASFDATVNADRAVVENARLQLKYCYIYSPITGRTGTLFANEGNLIKANADNPMVIVNQIQPIYVTFSVAEQYLPEIKKYMSSGKVLVEAFITKGEDNPEEGMLIFVDNTVDVATGTIKLKATFVNKGKRLWPGQFVDVVMILTTQPNTIVIPSQSIQTGQKGQYVFVIKNDLTVEDRVITVGRTINSETVVEKGLQVGEKVVTDGQLRLVPGAKVEIKNQEIRKH
ncbi:MAG TPA: efflux RND transporter periplasmic adaptor subunit [Thermodesulfovibrionales bacterium]|nr:efflux RND transporter periplasmic adaptor subunit [Thermodesulfovibrionales bacterium]